MTRAYLKRLRRLWQPPRPYGELDQGRTVSFLELFSDLAYVALIAVVAHELAGHMQWAAVGEFAVIFGLIWVAWLNGAAEYDLHGREDLRTRVFTFAQMLLLALLAVYAAEGADGREAFALVYGALFVLLAWLGFTVHLRSDAHYRRTSRSSVALCLLTVAAMAGSAFAPPPAQLWAWGAVVVVWLAAAFVLARAGAARSRDATVVAHSFVERFGLFTIIVLGEVVFGVVNGLAESARDAETIVTGLLALGVGFGLWWNYFDLTGRRLPRGGRGGLPIWIPLHLPLTMSIAAAGAAMISIIAHAGDPRAPLVATWVLSGSVTVALMSIAAIVPTLQEWQAYRRVYLPTSILMAVVALAATPLLALTRPSSIELAAALLGLLALVWLVAVSRWLVTEGWSSS